MLFVGVLGLFVYSNTIHSPFQFDDATNIIENPIIKDLQYFSGPSNAKAFPLYNTFKNRFIGFLTFALNYRLHGLDVTGYHIVNLAIHIINALLVYWLVLLTFKAHSSWLMAHSKKTNNHGLSAMSYDLSAIIALFSALLFVAHPIQTQAVTYIVQRFTSLATLFYLLSLVLYIKFRLQVAGCKLQKSETKTLNSKLLTLNPMFLYLASVLSAVLAMKTKEIAFTLPIIIVLYEFSFFTETFNFKLLTLNFKKFLFLTPFLLTLLIIPLSYIGTDTSAGDLLSDVSETARLQTDMSRLNYLFTEFRVVVTYIRLLFLPVNQNLDYDYPIYNSFLNPNVFLSLLLLLSIFGLGVYLFYCSKNPPPSPFYKGGIKGGQASPNSLPITHHALRITAFGIFWFFITLSVESSVIPIEDVIFEHRVYLPGIGLIIAFVSFVFYLFLRFKPHLPLTACYLLLTTSVVVLSIASYQRNAIWKDEISLWTDVVSKSPNKARGYNGIGIAYKKLKQYAKAIEQFRNAARLDSKNAEAHYNLGNTYKDLGLIDNALSEYQTALAIDPYIAEIHFSFANVLKNKGLIDEAIEHYKIAIKLQPDFTDAHNFLGFAYYYHKKQLNEAVEEYQIALKQDPRNATTHLNLGIVYKSMGQADKAMEHFNIARELNPALYKTGSSHP